MRLSSLNPGQHLCATTFGKPMSVAAGAGSGKTYTLATRIVYAFTPESGEGAPVVDDIGQVCAITYTSAAANELRSRVKGMLREQGLIDQAMRSDEAWISTIHGMCSRILKTNALELGIDPDFQVLMNADYDRMRDRAVQFALGSEGAGFDSFPSRADLEADPAIDAAWIDEVFDVSFDASDLIAEFGTETLQSIIILLNAQQKRTGIGFDGIRFLNGTTQLIRYVQEVKLAYQEVLGAYLTAPKQPTVDYQTPCDAGIAQMDALLDALPKMSQADAAQAVRHVLTGLPVISAKNLAGCMKPSISGPGGLQFAYAKLALAARMQLADDLVEPLKQATHRFDVVFSILKARARVLDNDDLILRTLEAFKTRPGLVAAYKDKFRMVMVDEFQDTNQLQLDLIKYLAGENLERLCTVGDAQQSIYRFQGADVSVFRNHASSVRDDYRGALPCLTVNYRSHGDVLAFVEAVFSGEEAFGDEFLHLDACENRRGASWPAELPRVTILHDAYSGRVSTGDLRQAEAKAIARTFAGMVGKTGPDGRVLRPKDMVLLLGGMKHADVYAKAIRAEGLTCIISGGSVLGRLPETATMAAAADLLRNPADDRALFKVLVSPLFCVPEEELLRLTLGEVCDGCRKKQRLSKGVAGLLKRLESGQRDAVMAEYPFAGFAATVLGNLYGRAGDERLSVLLRDLVADSGWATRLYAQGADGVATAANALKVVRLAEDMEQNAAASFASVAEMLSAYLTDNPNEKPGALSGEGGDFVSIKTIHSSKGLEYPVVAVAEYEEGIDRDPATLPGNKTSAHGYTDALLAKESFDSWMEPLGNHWGSKREAGKPKTLYLDGEEISGADDACATLASVVRAKKAELTAERQRLLYVALTRAREALIVPVRSKISQAKNGTASAEQKQMAQLITLGLGCDPETGLPQSDCNLAFGGEQPARLVMVKPVEDQEPGADGQAANKVFTAPDILRLQPQPCGMPPSNHAGVFSYSGISDAAVHGDGDEVAHAAPRVTEDGQDDDFADLQSDREKATAFGSAFHLCAQYAVETRRLPCAARIDGIAAKCGVVAGEGPKDLPALHAALDAWFASSAFAAAKASAQWEAEVPFFLQMEEAYLEGSIDLLCTDGPVGKGSHAVLFDYKTGGSDDETPQERYGKHLLQAQCYAYALMMQGCASVEAHFLRVQRAPVAGMTTPGAYGDKPTFADVDTVDYRFTADQLEALRAIIMQTYWRHQATNA